MHHNHRGPGRNPAGDTLIEVLGALIRTGIVRDSEHLAEIVEGMFPHLAIEAKALRNPALRGLHPTRGLGVFAALGELRYQRMLFELTEQGVAGGLVAIAPLPPHLLEALTMTAVLRCFVVPDHHPVPPPLRGTTATVIFGRRAAVAATADANALVFEAARRDEGLVIDPDVLDVVAPLLSVRRAFIHLRGHPHLHDVPLDVTKAEVFYL